ncbi:unnamed protein product [Cochlearia groenlandica]
MPMPWKKTKSGRISRFVSDLQQSPKHGGSLVVETGFPTSLIDLFVKNRDRIKKRSNDKATATTRRRVSSPPPPPFQRRSSLPVFPPSVTEDPAAAGSKIVEESFVGDGGLTAANEQDGDGDDGRGEGGGGGCVLMVVAFKVFVVAVLALSTKKLAVGISLSAFALLFLELAVARVLTLFNLCPHAQARLHHLIGKLIGKKKHSKEKLEESTTSKIERRNTVSFEIIESFDETIVPKSEISTLDKEKHLLEEKQTIRDIVFKKEKSKSAKLKSKIVKKIVPKKLRSYKKKRKMMKIKLKEGEEQEVEVIEEEEEEDEDVSESVTEVSSLFSEERISDSDEIDSNPPLLEKCEEEGECGRKVNNLTKAIVLVVIVLAGLLNGKVLAIVLTISSCLVLKLVCSKSRTCL